MIIPDLLFGYNEAFNASGTHIRDDPSGIDIYVKETPNFLVVTAWGSTENKDWITDFKFMLKRWKLSPLSRKDSPIRVHSGYIDGWMRIREQVLSLVKGDNIFVNGYSMGGGLSSIIAVDIQYNKNPKNLLCADFEGPKVWNKAGRDSFNRRVPNAIKMTYSNDIVPKVPFWYKFGGKLIHIGQPVKWYKLSIKNHIDAVLSSEVRTLLSNLPIDKDGNV